MPTLATLQPNSASERGSLFELLRSPVAMDASGRALSALAHERARELSASVAAHLRELCASPIELRLAPRVAALALFDDGGAVELELAGERSLWIALDARATRALVDALALRHLGLRGVGELTGAERGLLEFAALSCLDRCAGGARVRRFLFGRELGRIALDASLSAVEFDLRCGAGGGSARALVKLESDDPPLVLESQRALDELDLRVALPSVTLSRAERDALVSGDVLLLGTERLAGFATRVELVTSGGWRVCAAELVGDCALTVSVRVGALDARVLHRRGGERGGVTISPFIASRRLARESFERWRAGDELTLDKRAVAALDLVCSDGMRWTGEFVRVGGELGLRVCSSVSAPLEPA